MALIRGGLTVKENSRDFKQCLVNFFFDPPFSHQGHETSLVILPGYLLVLVIIEDIFGGGEYGHVDVFSAAQFLEKEGKVIPLGEPGKLRRVVQSHIYQTFDCGLSQCAEELSSFFLGKTDCVDFHSDHLIIPTLLLRLRNLGLRRKASQFWAGAFLLTEILVRKG